MNLRMAARLSGVALAATMSGTILMRPAVAQRDGIERYLAGIRVNSNAKTVLNLFGNPNDIQIGDTPVRPPSNPGAGQQGGMGGPGMMSGSMSPGMGGMSGSMAGPGGDGGGAMVPGSMGGGPGAGRGGMGPGGPGAGGGMAEGMAGGPGKGRSSSMGSMGGMGPGGPGGGGGMMEGMGGGKSGMMGPGGMGGPTDGMGGGGPMMGNGGGGVGMSGFGQTTSPSTPQQEVTWIYNTQARDAKGQKQAISYEFLISPDGKVSQIRVIGYVPKTKNDKSSKGLTLGSTYKDVIRLYGAPKSVMKSGDLLVCSYPSKHIEFQLMNMRSVNGYADPYKGIFKIVAIQINATE